MSYSVLNVRDHIPLEQGLRHSADVLSRSVQYVRDHIPLEQGLRLVVNFLVVPDNHVRDHIPLEQGLRRWDRPCLPCQPESETIFH